MKFINKEYFYFTKHEKYGISILIFFILILVCLPFITPNLIDSKIELDIKKYSKTIKAIELVSIDSTKFFSFNINKSNYYELKKFGFRHQQTVDILKYREKNTQFKNKNELLKIKSIATIYNKIKKYILLKSKYKNKFYSSGFPIYINKCFHNDLTQIFGIGNTLAARILNYRNKLGGFISFKQFSEIYNLKKDIIRSLVKNTVIDSTKITTLDLNNTSYVRLMNHPYFTKDIVKTIFMLKKEYLEIDLQMVKENLSSEEYNKIRHYIKQE